LKSEALQVKAFCFNSLHPIDSGTIRALNPGAGFLLEEHVGNRRREQFYLVLAVVVLEMSVGSATLRASLLKQGGSEPRRSASKPSGAASSKQARAGDAAKAEGPSTALPSDYRIGPEDELTVSVWHEPEFSQAVVVRPDGMVTLPLINEVKVAGLTTEEMQVLLTEKLKPVVNDPQVTVIVKAVKSRKVFVVGNIAKQGVYALGGKKTVLEVIAEAGGLGPFAKSKSIYILRKEGDKEVRIPFNYKKALSGNGSNPELMTGDMVVVP
jgi:polysaccharide export outer membrane protein